MLGSPLAFGNLSLAFSAFNSLFLSFLDECHKPLIPLCVCVCVCFCIVMRLNMKSDIYRGVHERFEGINASRPIRAVRHGHRRVCSSQGSPAGGTLSGARGRISSGGYVCSGGLHRARRQQGQLLLLLSEGFFSSRRGGATVGKEGGDTCLKCLMFHSLPYLLSLKVTTQIF